MFSNSLRVAVILLLLGAATALAQVNVIPILIAPAAGPSGALLLEDNSSILLLENNTDQLCLEGGC
jgi:hypothetical protein